MTGKELSGEGLRKSGYAEHISFGIGDEYWYFGIVDFARPYPFAFNECYAVVKLMMGGVVADIDIVEDRRAVITPKKIGEILVYMKSCKN